MLRKLRQRIESEEKGFTLIELLVVMLIIGILAAIALPIFLNQQDKGRDASAKSDARNLVSQVESCNADNPPNGYAGCDTIADLEPGGQATGLPLGDGAPAASSGNVGVSNSGQTTFTVAAASKSGQFYTITKSGDTVSHKCGDALNAAGEGSGASKGGCKANAW